MGNPKDAGCAIEEDLGELVRNIEEGTQGTDVKLLASGGYNDIWLVKRPIEGAKRFVLRKPREDALLPDQIRNEVACLEYIKKNLSNIPVPRVYSHYFKDSSSEGVFIAEELIEGDRLSDVWSTFDESTKMSFARQIAEIIVDLGERNFSGIGGLMLDGKLGPTVEGMKLFKGRVSITSVFGKRYEIDEEFAEPLPFASVLRHWTV